MPKYELRYSIVFATIASFTLVLFDFANLAGTCISAGRNCVDACVVEFAKIHGVYVSVSDLAVKAEQLGMRKTPHDRSLLDAVELLKSTGVFVRAIPLGDVSNLDGRLPAIVYLPDPDGARIGHVVIVVREKGRGYLLLDPGAGSAPRSIDIPELVGLENSILITCQGAIRNFYLRAFFICFVAVFVGALVFSFLKNGLRKVLFVGLIAILTSGCDRPSQCVVKEADVDFGDVIDPDSGKVLSHEFEIHNYGEDAKIANKVSSCTCVVYTGDNSEILIPKGKSYVLTVGVSVGTKTGAFEEEVRLLFEDPAVKPILLTLRGLVLRGPSSMQPLVQFDYKSGEPMVKNCMFTHKRRSNDKPMEIEDLRILSEFNSDLFSAGAPSRREMVVEDLVMTDVWEVPVRFTNNQIVGEIEAVLSVAWKSRNETTNVRLLARQAKSLELVEGKMVLISSVGKQSMESIPLRIFDPQNARRVKVNSSVGWCDAEVDADKSLLYLRLVPPSAGTHSVNLTLKEDDRSIGELVVTVFAH